jgi:hypothetical protein
MAGDGPSRAISNEALGGLAENPAVPPEMIWRLLARPRRLPSVAKRPDLTDAMAAEIMARDDQRQVHALALNPRLDHRTRMVLARHRDPVIRAAAVVGESAGTGPVERELFEALIDDPSREVRQTLACTDAVPADLRARLAADPEPQIRILLAQWWAQAPENVRDVLLTDQDEKVRCAAFTAYFQQLDLDDARIGLLARHPDSEVRARLAAHPDLPGHVLEELTGDPSPMVRLAVFARADTPEAVRATIYADITEHRPTLDDLMAAGDGFDLGFEYLPADATLRMLRPAWVTAEAERHVDSPYPCFRAAAARSTLLPIEAVRRLLDDEDEQVRISMAHTAPHLVDAERAERIERTHRWDKFTMWWEYEPVLCHASETLRRFATDPEPRLRALAAGDPELLPEIASELATDPEPSVRAAVAGHPNLPTEYLVALLDDHSDQVVHAAAASPHLPVDQMERLLLQAGL